jgi:hypothetical protein
MVTSPGIPPAANEDADLALDRCAQLADAVDAVLAAAADPAAAARGWLLPVEDDALRGAWLAYWRARLVLLEQVEALRAEAALPAHRFPLALAQVLSLAGLRPSPTSGHRRGAAPLCSLHLGAAPGCAPRTPSPFGSGMRRNVS